jgi:arylsulfatase A-like enzyme
MAMGACALISCQPDRTDDAGSGQERRHPNIIILTVDTLRPDHMALYGYHRNTMPAIEAFARSAVVFDNAVVFRGNTRASYASMLTGLYPFHSGVHSNAPVLHDDLTTFPEILQSAGYHTAAFVSNFVLVGELSGCNQGFDIYDDRLGEREANRSNFERTAINTLAAILEWLEPGPPQPFLLFTNFIDPHGPYTPPKKVADVYQSENERWLDPEQIPTYQQWEGSLDYYDYVDRYDGEIRYVDQALGILIEQLKQKGLWEDALVIFAGDHGESLGEHKIFFEHQLHLWEETTRVPMAIRLPYPDGLKPASETQRVGSLVSPMDFMPTILAHLDIPCSDDLDGCDLLPVMEGRDNTQRTLFLACPDYYIPWMSVPDIYAVRTATHKLIRILDQGTGKVLGQLLYNIARDPLEREPIARDDEPILWHELSREMNSMLAEFHSYELPFTLTVYEMPLPSRPGFVAQRMQDSRKTIRHLSQEQIERLRSLGYVK